MHWLWSRLHSDWWIQILKSTSARKASIGFWKSCRTSCIEWLTVAFGVMLIVKLQNDGPTDCEDSTKLYGEVLVERCICLLYALVGGFIKRSSLGDGRTATSDIYLNCAIKPLCLAVRLRMERRSREMFSSKVALKACNELVSKSMAVVRKQVCWRTKRVYSMTMEEAQNTHRICINRRNRSRTSVELIGQYQPVLMKF